MPVKEHATVLGGILDENALYETWNCEELCGCQSEHLRPDRFRTRQKLGILGSSDGDGVVRYFRF